MRAYKFYAPQPETSFSIDDLKIYDRDDNEIVVNVSFDYDWIDREVINLCAKDAATGEYVAIASKQFYKNQFNDILHECHEHVANRTETLSY